MKRRIVLLSGICVLFLAGVLLVCCRKRAPETGGVALRVMDGRTDEAVKRALVVVPEAGVRRYTDADGHTGRIEVPILRDVRFDGIFKKDWGEITVLVYCEGYYPVALFFVQVQSNRDRAGPTVYLFPDDGRLNSPYALIESPENEWVEALLGQFQP